MKQNRALDGLFGLCVGDALGLPVEGVPREVLRRVPVTDMGYQESHRSIPAGWWSDDSSLSFCLAESLSTGFDIQDIAHRFLRWLFEGYWTPKEKAFGIGYTTARAIERIRSGINPEEAGGKDEYSNGNGSLMRILPLAFYLENNDPDNNDLAERFDKIHSISSITHAHPRSHIACGIYIQFAMYLLQGYDPKASYLKMKETILNYYRFDPYRNEMKHFSRILVDDVSRFSEDEIYSSGYVVDTLEASIFCFLEGDSYEKTVLKAVNLGGDTDTTGAVTGGLAGIYYGFRNIPERWLESIAKKDEIILLAERLNKRIYSR